MANTMPRRLYRSQTDRGRHRAALILVAVGLIPLAANLGMLRWLNWSLYWPLVLVALGGCLLIRQERPASK